MRYEKRSFADKAQAAWGNPLPDWIAALAEACDRSTQAEIAKRLGSSTAVISHVLAKNYAGNLQRVEENVRGALLGATVNCPVLGEIGTDRCLAEQKMGNTFSSAMRGAIYRNCRGNGVPKCMHSQIKGGGNA